MAEIVNLRRARKQKARQEAGKQADQNRVVFGLSKAERTLAKAGRAQAERNLEGHRLDREDEPGRP